MNSSINQLQLLQQNLQNILLQKQQFQNQLAEIDSALENVQGAEKAYKIVGHIMIASSPEKLTPELEEKKEMLALRLKNYIAQEEKLKKSMEAVQKEAVKELGNKNE